MPLETVAVTRAELEQIFLDGFNTGLNAGERREALQHQINTSRTVGAQSTANDVFQRHALTK